MKTKKILAVVLSVIVLLSSAPLGGFIDVDWSDFALKASAASYNGMTYTVKNGEVTITDCDTSKSGVLTIPLAIEGYPVTSIGSYAFSGCYRLTSVTIPGSVTSIGNSAFLNCDNLKIIEIPNGVTSIGDSSFSLCKNLTNIKIPDSVTSISDDIFAFCESLTNIKIPDSVTSIGDEAFEYCNSLTYIEIPDSVTSIGNYAFRGCNNLKKVVFKGKAPTISSNSFSGCETTAFYPYKENGWKSAIKSNYGGNTNWVAYSKNTLEKFEVTSSSKKTVYNIGDKIDFRGLALNATWSDGLVETITPSSVQLEQLKFSKSVADKAGENIITASYCGKEVEFKVYAHNLKDIIVNASEYPESAHNYADNLNETKTFSYPGATKIAVTFSAKTLVEKDGDYIYVNGTRYTGDSLAGRTITVSGNKLTINLISNKYGNYYGYSIDKIKVTVVEHTYKAVTAPATITANGKTETKCTTCGKVSKTTTIYCPKTFTLSATSFTYTGKEIKPTVTVKDSNGNKISSSNYTVKYASGRKSVGKYTVTVTFKGNYSGTKTLSFKIVPKGTEISSVSAASCAFTAKWKKQSSQTTGYQLQYSTSSSFSSAKTVSVNKNTTVSQTVSKLKGNTKYYVRVRTYKTVDGENYYSDWSAKESVTTKPPVGITMKSSSETLCASGSKTLLYSIYPTKAKVIWKSSNTSVAKVSSKGKVTAIKNGTATITASFKSGGKTYKDTCKITVKTPSITLNKTSATIYKCAKVGVYSGGSVKLTAKTIPSGQKIKWSTSNSSVAKVSTTGKVAGVKAGTTTITASFSYGGKTYSKSCKIKVESKSSISIKHVDWTINYADGVEPEVTIVNNTKEDIKYINFKTTYYNAVGDKVYNDIGGSSTRNLQITGPFKAGQKETFYWDAVFYNGSVDAIRISDVKITYMNGKTEKISYNKLWTDQYYYAR